MSESQITVTEQPENEAVQVETNEEIKTAEGDMASLATEDSTKLHLVEVGGSLMTKEDYEQSLNSGQERSGPYDGTGRR